MFTRRTARLLIAFVVTASLGVASTAGVAAADGTGSGTLTAPGSTSNLDEYVAYFNSLAAQSQAAATEAFSIESANEAFLAQWGAAKEEAIKISYADLGPQPNLPAPGSLGVFSIPTTETVAKIYGSLPEIASTPTLAMPTFVDTSNSASVFAMLSTGMNPGCASGAAACMADLQSGALGAYASLTGSGVVGAWLTDANQQMTKAENSFDRLQTRINKTQKTYDKGLPDLTDSLGDNAFSALSQFPGGSLIRGAFNLTAGPLKSGWNLIFGGGKARLATAANGYQPGSSLLADAILDAAAGDTAALVRVGRNVTPEAIGVAFTQIEAGAVSRYAIGDRQACMDLLAADLYDAHVHIDAALDTDPLGVVGAHRAINLLTGYLIAQR